MNRFIKTQLDAVNLLDKYSRKRQENFIAVSLNQHHDVIKIHLITKGLVNKTIAHPRECFYPILKDYATGVIFAHNHPSGYVNPSPEDDELYERLVMAGHILGIKVVDELIIAKHGMYYSYLQQRRIKEIYSYEETADFVEMLAAERSDYV